MSQDRHAQPWGLQASEVYSLSAAERSPGQGVGRAATSPRALCCVSLCVSFKDVCHWLQGPSDKPDGLTLITSAKTLFPNRHMDRFWVDESGGPPFGAPDQVTWVLR